MKVLVATSRSQGSEEGDYCWTSEGEVVRLVDCPDDYCRCSAFGGVESHRATTTALVIERPDLDPGSLFHLFRQDWVNQGWAEHMPVPELEEAITAEIAELVLLLRDLAPGTVVERTPANLRVRQAPAA
jgi:hypothetical protein